MAQRPLSIDQVRPIIDSVQTEINRLYNISKALEKATALFEQQPPMIQKKMDQHLCYFSKDSAYVLLIDSANLVLVKYSFSIPEFDLNWANSNEVQLLKKEQLLLQAKRNALQQFKDAKQIELINTDEVETEIIFHPNRHGYTLYAIAVPKVDSILPSGMDYRLLFDEGMNLQSIKSFSKSFKLISIRKKDMRSQALLSITAPIRYDQDFSPLVPYFYRFRRYHENLKLSEMGGAINKRSYRYNAIKNEIEISLFPSEK